MAKVLLVEDDTSLATKIQQWLEHEHYVVDWVEAGEDALQLLDSNSYDCIVMDWGLPGISGLDVCKTFRARGGNTPVIFLTGRGKIEEKTTGLDTGGDDYITKPCDLKELSARLRAILRRHASVRQNTITVGSLTIETGVYRVTNGGEEVTLLPKEFAVLELLMRHPGQIFSVKDILQSVWPADSVAGEDTVRTYIKTLKRKITREGEESLLQNIHGFGYTIKPPV
jgi:DNA-binding response OmpR family regulator